MPKVSVIVPNYNHSKYLEQRIQSVLNQTYTDFELIYLDDASTDNSNEIFTKYEADPRVRSIINRSNSGNVFKQWNKGLLEAKGEYVWIAESDDYADENFLAELVSVLDNNPSVGVVYSGSWVVDSDGNNLFKLEDIRKRISNTHWSSSFIRNGHDELRDFFLAGPEIANASSALTRTSVVQSIGYADENWKQAGDWIFWTKVLSVSDIAFVSKHLNYWRKHSNTVTRGCEKSGKHLEEAYRACRMISQLAGFDNQSLVRARSEHFNRWMYYNEVKFNGFRQNIEIFRAAAEFDPRVRLRLLFYMPRFPLMVVIRRFKVIVDGLMHK